MSFGQLAVHCAELFGWGRWAVTTLELDFAQTPYQPFKPHTNDELLDYFDKQAAETIAAISSAADETLAQMWTLRNGEQIYFAKPKIEVVRIDVFNHIFHHRGQLTVYLRLNDIPVPPLYGPTADEQMM